MAAAQRIRHLLTKELAQIRRDRSLFGILVVAPIFQLLILGFAATTDIRNISLGIRDRDQSELSREYVRTVTASGYFKPRVLSGPDAEDARALVSGQAGVVLVIPRGFAEDLLRGTPTRVQVLIDGADSNFAVHGLNYINQATRQFTTARLRGTLNEAIRLNRIQLPSLRAETRVWYNPSLTSRRYMVPALMGVLLLVTTMLVTSMALVKEREEGTMEQLIVTPLRPLEIMIGKLTPFAIIGYLELTLAIVAIRIVFGITAAGSLGLLYLLSGLFLLNTLGMGLLVSTIARTQQQAMMIAAFFVMMPFVLLSGFIFPVENMPPAFQPVTALLPLRHYLDILRDIFLKGTGLACLWPQTLALLASGVFILALATRTFHKRLD
jgi:ABC-2 type transport system permease protein